MQKIIVGSNNEHKIKEIKEILKEMPFEVISLKDAGIDADVVEDGETFMDNAYKKASEIYELIKSKEDCMVLSDDSGLEVDALGGAPGVFSARFAGEHGNSRKNNEKLLQLLEKVPFKDRTARFVCAIVLLGSGERVIKVQGESEGYIIEEERGGDGFGYDPLFFVPEFNKTYSEMTSEEKNMISHRGRALKMLKEKLAENS